MASVEKQILVEDENEALRALWDKIRAKEAAAE